jgi:hypothetical protein
LEPPDPLEKKVRFGCGFVFGLLIVGFSGFMWMVVGGYYVVALAMACGLVCGLLAIRYGDHFWYSMRNWLYLLFPWF